MAFGENQLKEIAVEKLLKRGKPFFQKVMPVTAFLLLSMEWSHKKFFYECSFLSGILFLGNAFGFRNKRYDHFKLVGPDGPPCNGI